MENQLPGGQDGRTGARGGRLDAGVPYRLREMDFLNIPMKWYQPDATDRNSPSRLNAVF